jgi:energy-coupling factor transporter transmembrane protein EcfT
VRWVRAVLILAGTGVMAYAVYGAVRDPESDLPGQLAFLAAVVVAHDLFFMPIVLLLAAVAVRYAPAPARAPLRVAGLISIALTLLALPFVLGFGRTPDLPSALPLNYTRGLLVFLGIVWGVAVLWALAAAVRKRT